MLSTPDFTVYCLPQWRHTSYTIHAGSSQVHINLQYKIVDGGNEKRLVKKPCPPNTQIKKSVLK